MKKHGKKYRAALEKIEPGRKYDLATGVAKIKELSFAKFDETVELTVWLGVDPRKADQLVRGTLVLPHGIGKSKTVLVIAQGDKLREAEEAGADIVMLDNQTPEEAAKLVEMSRNMNPGVLIEASGGMELERVRAYAEAGVDLISVGKLTHSARAVDISFKIQTI